ncbi:DUF3157 domain-containing protein [Salinimicrobium sp. GXAS 041]|uniref:DUF3157 domain-containing protein n=1 Tax=Salinimicrobium sp. GXAS 041 TaxID=3400806 RepID=UPI003C737C23
MKKLLLIVLLALPFATQAQTIIATTNDGREVLLKEDHTWQFLDPTPKPNNNTSSSDADCKLPENFEEPKGDKGIQRWLKRGDATVADLKKHVAVDLDVKPEEVILMKISEQKGNGNYVLCVNGKKVQYRRVGTVFMEKGESPF